MKLIYANSSKNQEYSIIQDLAKNQEYNHRICRELEEKEAKAIKAEKAQKAKKLRGFFNYQQQVYSKYGYNISQNIPKYNLSF